MMAMACALTCALACGNSDTSHPQMPTGPPPNDTEPPPTMNEPLAADLEALLGDVIPGLDLAGWRVLNIALRAGRVDLYLERDGTPYRVWFTRKGTATNPAPHETARYSLFFESPPPGVAVDPTAILGALAAHLARTESTVPVPAGL